MSIAPPVSGPVLAPRVAEAVSRRGRRSPAARRQFAGRPDAARPEAGRADAARPDAARGSEGRPGFVRPGERPGAPPATVAAPADRRAATPRDAPGPFDANSAGGATARDRTGTPPGTNRRSINPTIVEPATPRTEMRSGVPREIAGSEGRSPQRVPPSPVQRNAEPREAIGRPSFAPRDARPATDANVEGRGMPGAAAAPVAADPESADPRGDGSASSGPSAAAPRLPEQGRVEPVRPAVVNRPAEAAVVAPPVQHPAEAQRPPGDARKARPETPGREERRDERRDEKGAERQR